MNNQIFKGSLRETKPEKVKLRLILNDLKSDVGIHISLGAEIHLNMEWNSELHERGLMSQGLMSHSLWPDRHRSWRWTVAVHCDNSGGIYTSTSELFKLIS